VDEIIAVYKYYHGGSTEVIVDYHLKIHNRRFWDQLQVKCAKRTLKIIAELEAKQRAQDRAKKLKSNKKESKSISSKHPVG